MKFTKKLSFIILFAMLFSIFYSLGSFTVSAATKAEPSGAYLKFTVDVNKPDGEVLAFNYYYFKNLEYVIEEGDMLEYDVWISLEETGWGHIDGDITDTGNLRDNKNFNDQDGNGFHTGNDISYYAYDKWYHRIINLGVTEDDAIDEKYTVGRTLNFVQVSMHPSVDDNNYQGFALYDNLVITNNGEVKLVLFKDEGDWNADEVRLSHQKDSTSTLEMLVFTAEEEQTFKDAEEAAIKAAEEKEAARLAAEEERKEREEQAKAEAELLAAEQAESDMEATVSDISETTPEISNSSSNNDDDNGINIGLIIGIIVGVVVIIVIIIVIASKKKK